LDQFADYLRDQAAKYRAFAETTEEPFRKQEFFSLASVCDEAAESLEDRHPCG
jgi:hypothetical protein